jgi:hypothetical protein
MCVTGYSKDLMNEPIGAYEAGEFPPSMSRSATLETGLCSGGKRGEFNGTESDRLLDCIWYITGDDSGKAPIMDGSKISPRSEKDGSLNGARTLLDSDKES